MVPLKLELKNFLSYGELQVVDFSEHNLICLSGKNGHGKSAILDAITWAIWGQARKVSGTSKPDEGLLKIGQSKLLVVLTFKIEQDVYRVRREFIKSGHSKTIPSLELAIASPSGEFLALTEKSIRQTQRKIDTILKIDYETFINSSFLRQGNANEFSKKSPRERKLLLTKILGFDLYDKMQQKSIEQLREIINKQKSLTIEENKNEEALKELPALLEKKKGLEQLLAVNQAKLTETKNTKAQLDEKRLEINKKIEEVKKILEQKEEAAKSIVEYREKMRSIIEKWRTLHQSILQSSLAKDCRAKLTSAEESLLILENKLLKKVELSQEVAKLKALLATTIEKERESCAKAKNAIEKEIFATEKSETTLTLKKEKLLANITEHTAKFSETEKQITDCQNTIKILQDEITSLSLSKNKIAKLERLLMLFTSKEKQFAKQQLEVNLDLDGKENCPSCGQKISKELYLQFHQIQNVTLQRLNHQLVRIKNLRPKFFKMLKHEQGQNALLNEKEQQIQILTSKISESHAQKILLQKASHEMQQALQQTQTDLDLATFAKAKKIKELEVLELNNQTFFEQDPTIAALKTEINAAEALLQTFAAIAQDFASQKNLVETLRLQVQKLVIKEQQSAEQKIWKERYCETKLLLKMQQNNFLVLAEKLGNTERLKTEYLELKKVWEATNSLILLAEQEQNKLYQEFAAAKAVVDLREKLRQENEDIRKTLAELCKEIADLELLGEAFGKNGIQALLIEDVIPEIEQATNQILSLITETSAKVFIEPLRDLKKGGVKESLDIIISDINGIRDYEMFSGGEAFRIDFALRIGISQVIANRGGINLKTLIIDEGFGALDEEGINLMIQCLYKIANRFEKVIVVSHLPVFKEMFPVHFCVTKCGTGSTISVEYRG